MSVRLREMIGAHVDKILCLTCPQSIGTRFPAVMAEFSDMGLGDMVLPFPNAHSAIEHMELNRRRYSNNDSRIENVQNCSMGHYHMAKFALDAGYRGVMIIEDDARFVRPAAMIDTYFADYPDNANSILSYRWVQPVPFHSAFPSGAWSRWGRLPGGVFFDLATAYILNRDGMECAVDYYEKCGSQGYKWPLDACDRIWPHLTESVPVYIPRVNLVVSSGTAAVTIPL